MIKLIYLLSVIQCDKVLDRVPKIAGGQVLVSTLSLQFNRAKPIQKLLEIARPIQLNAQATCSQSYTFLNVPENSPVGWLLFIFSFIKNIVQKTQISSQKIITKPNKPGDQKIMVTLVGISQI